MNNVQSYFERFHTKRYTIGQIQIIRRLKEAVYLENARIQGLKHTHKDATQISNITMKGDPPSFESSTLLQLLDLNTWLDIRPEFLGSTGLPITLIEAFQDDVQPFLEWLQKIENHMKSHREIPTISVVRISLARDTENGKNILRCDSVISRDVDGNAIADHLEFIDGRVFYFVDDVINHVASELEIDPNLVKIVN